MICFTIQQELLIIFLLYILAKLLLDMRLVQPSEAIPMIITWNEYLVRTLTSYLASSSSIAQWLSRTSKHWKQGKDSQDQILRNLCLPTYMRHPKISTFALLTASHTLNLEGCAKSIFLSNHIPGFSGVQIFQNERLKI